MCCEVCARAHPEGIAGMKHDIGGRIRHAREQRGFSLHDAASLTKLSVPVLQAIERNDFDSLPAGVYRKAYLRTVAAEVGLDPGEVAADYATLHEGSGPGVAVLRAAAESPRWWARRSLIALVILAALVATWLRLSS